MVTCGRMGMSCGSAFVGFEPQFATAPPAIDAHGTKRKSTSHAGPASDTLRNRIDGCREVGEGSRRARGGEGKTVTLHP